MGKFQDDGVVSLHETLPGIREIYYRNDANSPLLRLPAEIRLYIYECVVSSPYLAITVLKVGEGVFTGYFDEKEWNEANVLQRVCKKTRSETRRLEFKVNHVGMNEDLFAQLTLTNNWRLQHFRGTIVLRKVEGVSLHPSRALLHGVILKYARENPGAQLRIIVTDWTVGKKWHIKYFLCLGWMIERAVRRKQTPFSPGFRRSLELWKGPDGNPDLDNITFYPSAPSFNLRRFRSTIRSYDQEFVRNFALKTYYGNEADLTEAVRGWFEKGI